MQPLHDILQIAGIGLIGAATAILIKSQTVLHDVSHAVTRLETAITQLRHEVRHLRNTVRNLRHHTNPPRPRNPQPLLPH